ncbi:MAG: hypothetical protein HOP29_08490 [Phycisphaerales bacterium]|nr:hypothetical protein [Phycisphaerales bacterium]
MIAPANGPRRKRGPAVQDGNNDGAIDVFDILCVLDGFAGVNGCNCPAGP